jgi:GDP-L-fucose synthase
LKKIVVFGGSGMVGTNLLEKLDSFLSPSSSEVDLTNRKEVISYLSSIKPHNVINLAGKVGGIKSNLKNNYEFLTQNLIINHNLIDACHVAGIKNFLNVSSSCIYPKNFKNPLKESDILASYLEPTNEGYALAKIVALKMCIYLNNIRGLNYKTIIPCNLYGPFDKFGQDSHMIPGVIKRVHDAKIKNLPFVEMWGDGSARREFMYAEDFVDFISFSLKSFDKLPLITNVGLGVDYTIKEYYKSIINIIGYKGKIKANTNQPIGMLRKKVDISNQVKLGWMPKTTLETGLKTTYKYFIENEI